ncbi:cupin domain-containing protein [Robiginitalea sp. SC105]|uniref:cupin domain-containing protein n=1 Tax=Robiginitalea sp. SC105 TaxID=2762332 RepID=UPI00163ABD9E|nr:cupin domain-containing protein [Robiginitalea sp. SC105]MBC2839289.1 cupin domain-containing protein [Robiginitalea sp. SC105]
MYQKDDTILRQPMDQLQIRRLSVENTPEVLSISLEKAAVFPEHVSPRDALLVVLEGSIDFQIRDASYRLDRLEALRFERDTPHRVTACTDSKFLIIR